MTAYQRTDRDPEIPEEQLVHRVDGAAGKAWVGIVDITPDLAGEWLRRNRGNRPIREDRVERYGELMEDGEWIVSPDAVAFSYTGKLINGQHRLEAIGQSDTSARCIVVTGLRPEAFKISDVGIKRTGADVLRIEGFKNAEEMAAVCRLLAMWKQGKLSECDRYENVRNAVIVDIATACRERLTETIEKVGSDKKALANKMPRSLMAFVYFAYNSSFPERAEHFFNGFVHGYGFPAVNWAEQYGREGAKNPIMMLKDKMRVHYDSLSRKQKLALLIKAMNYYCLEKPQKQLRWRVVDSFPEIAADMVPEIRDGQTSS